VTLLDIIEWPTRTLEIHVLYVLVSSYKDCCCVLNTGMLIA
jgi:hypothetical protein